VISLLGFLHSPLDSDFWASWASQTPLLHNVLSPNNAEALVVQINSFVTKVFVLAKALCVSKTRIVRQEHTATLNSNDASHRSPPTHNARTAHPSVSFHLLHFGNGREALFFRPLAT
jgi:hypothetical protein